MAKTGKAEKRTPKLRLRYIEAATKKDGNPFFALRVPADVLSAFRARCKARKLAPTAVVREYMAKLGGIELPGDGDE